MSAFYQEQGFTFGQPDARIQKKLQRLMGSDRYERYLDAADARIAGHGDAHDHYSGVKTVAEANCLMSFQSTLMLQSHRCLLRLCQSHCRAGNTIVELGCWTGTFSSWMATRYPNATMIGIDRLDALIEAATDNGVPPNCTLIAADYSRRVEWPFDPADLIVSSFGIDFDAQPVEIWPRNVLERKHSPAFETRKRESYQYFAALNSLSRPGTKARLVLRIPTFDHYSAFIAGAEHAGWRLEPCPIKDLSSGNERFPVISLERGSGELASSSIESMAAEWANLSADEIADLLESSEYQHVKEPQALALYLLLDNRKETETRTRTYDDGHTMTEVSGEWIHGEYLFARATTGYMSLQIGPPRCADFESHIE